MTIQNAVLATQTGQVTVENWVSVPVNIPVLEGCKLSGLPVDGTLGYKASVGLQIMRFRYLLKQKN